MQAVTSTGEFNFLIFWLIFTVKHVANQSSINFVETAALQPPPYRLDLDDSYLQLMSPKDRRKLCTQVFEELQCNDASKHQIISTPKSPPMSSNSAPTVFTYVPKAHVYKFDDEEEWLSIRCAALPPFYVSHEMTEKDQHYWQIRIVKPTIEPYEFRLETFVDWTDTDFSDEQTGTHLPPKTHYFYKMDTLKRWYLCSEARHMIDYPVEKIDDGVSERAKIHSFQYLNDRWTEEYLAFKCPGEPVIYLRTGDLENETNVIWIALLEEDEDEDLSETDTSDTDDYKMETHHDFLD